jgi:hypothetical protein
MSPVQKRFVSIPRLNAVGLWQNGSSLKRHIAATESVSLWRANEKLTAFIELESRTLHATAHLIDPPACQDSGLGFCEQSRALRQRESNRHCFNAAMVRAMVIVSGKALLKALGAAPILDRVHSG